MRHRYGETDALAGIDMEVGVNELFGIIGPDGVGKSTLLGLIAGARRLQEGRIRVSGAEMGETRQRRRVQREIAYMPQGLGQNLYGELEVGENLRFFADLYGVPAQDVEERGARLLAATGLEPFTRRRVAHLSGGMKQKLGLCCALIHRPALIILDEPTTGVDPLSRIQFWELIARIREQAERLTVLVASSYMAEAARFDRLAMMESGALLATGTPRELMDETGTDDLDGAYVQLLPEERRRDDPRIDRRRREASGDTLVEAEGLTRRFGDFTAVDDVHFAIDRGEIFGFVGPNGSGKTTTMKMVTGLLPMTEGSAKLAGKPVSAGDVGQRRRLGYMAQSFSLYGELTVRRNLELHAHLFSVPADELQRRVDEQLDRFSLTNLADAPSADLPLGIRQRLSLAVATIHEPEILILDEPTSGVDPVARNSLWALLIELSRERDTTILVSTHYLTEATRCDRIALMNEGRILAAAAPEDLVAERDGDDLEAVFIDLIREDRREHEKTDSDSDDRGEGAIAPSGNAPGRNKGNALRRLRALVRREALQIRRDPFRLYAAFVVPMALMLVFGFGLNLDIENLPFAVLDHDRSAASREYVQRFAGSRYFTRVTEAGSDEEIESLFQRGTIRLAIEIPARFHADLLRDHPAEVGLWVDGTMPYRAATARGYALATHAAFVRDRIDASTGRPPVTVASRYLYNQSLESENAFVPGVLAFVLMLVPAMLTAVAVVREKEVGSIANFHASPVRRLEFLLGKQIPFIAISLANFVLLAATVVVVFGIAPSGDVLALVIGGILFVTASTGFGLLISTFTRTQVSAALIALIFSLIPSFQYSGLLTPVSALEGGSYVLGRIFPATYFLNIAVGVFTKGSGFASMMDDFAALFAIALAFGTASLLLLREQAR